MFLLVKISKIYQDGSTWVVIYILYLPTSRELQIRRIQPIGKYQQLS